MPTYHYFCKSCKHEFEEFQKISDTVLVVCPVCHKHSLVRMMSGGAGVVFKGSGFYITDYKNKPNTVPKKETESEKKIDAKPSSESSTKEEDK